jgi:hypothetical protein
MRIIGRYQQETHVPQPESCSNSGFSGSYPFVGSLAEPMYGTRVHIEVVHGFRPRDTVTITASLVRQLPEAPRRERYQHDQRATVVTQLACR